jgi:hypothetical protein
MQVEVRHKSRGKNSSDETLRQEMRKLEDLSTEAGRIVLISGHQTITKDRSFSVLFLCSGVFLFLIYLPVLSFVFFSVPIFVFSFSSFLF